MAGCIRVALVLASVCAGSLVATPSPSVVAEPRPACSSDADSAVAAASSARACGGRVEVLSARTPYAQTFATAEGTMVLEQSVEPRWARRSDGSWSDVDTMLRFVADGSVQPVATVVPMSFSGGGAAPLARLTENGAELAVSWPRPLPVPAIEKDTARYREVLPGVDLLVTATALGFTQVLVVRDRVAASAPELRSIPFELSGKGVAVGAAVGGGAEAKDPSGRVVFTSPAPVMWDSGSSAVAGRASGGVRGLAVMPVSVMDDRIVITPDPGLLAGPDVRYPVYLDPGWSGGLAGNAWTSVWSRGDTANSSFWQNNSALRDAAVKGGAGAGRTEDCTGCGTYLIRSLFRMNVSGVLGKQILGAVFRVEQRWSWTCSPASAAKLWWTGPISSATTWNNQPNWVETYSATASANHRADGQASCAGVGDIEFPVTGLVQHTVSVGAAELTVGLRAINENTTNHWKRFNAGTPVLAVTYNSVPTMPTGLTVDGKPCAAGAGRPTVPAATPTLRATVADPDGQSQQVWFAYARWDTPTSSYVNIGGGFQDNVPNGATAQLTTAPLEDGRQYTFRAQSNDYIGGVSPVTHEPGNCEWVVDLTDPVVPTITGDIYGPGCSAPGCGAVGRTGRFTLRSSPDVVSFRWGFSDPPANVAPAASGVTVIDWTPTAGGPATLFVRAVDKAGRFATGRQQFTVAGPAPAVGRWRLDEPEGAVTLADVSDNGHPITLSGGGAGADGRFPGSRALALTGDRIADVNGRVLDTARSFSIATWAKLDDVSTGRALVGALGTQAAATQLWYSPTENRWLFGVSSADTATTGWSFVRSDAPPRPGVWTHLAGTYDAATGQLSLFVDGVRQKDTVAGARTWDAGSRIAVGRTVGGAPLRGSLSDLRLFDRVVTADELVAVVDPLTQASVGEWHMEEVGPGPAFDSSGMANDLTFERAVEIPPAGSGQTGTGLRLLADGHAHTEGPVVHTDQSFTVSAWVRLADAVPATPGPDLPASNWTAVSQGGAQTGNFYLGLRHTGGGESRWCLGMTHADSDAPGWTYAFGRAVLSGADVDRWTHLVGVHDASAGTMRLYVDGVLAQTTALPSRWRAGGPLIIGGALWSPQGEAPRMVDFWSGAIDEVRVYAGVVADVTRIP